MIVDDEPDIREGLKYLIDWEGHGFTICGEAENGRDALEQISVLSPDIVISDIRMPELDGLELLKKVHEAGSWIKFIILSGYSEFEYAKRAIKYKIADYLLKPVDEDELITLLEGLKAEIRQNAAFRPQNPLKTSTREVINKTIDFIEKNHAGGATLKNASLNVFLSEAYLGKLFKDETGESFHNYLNRVRIEKARDYMLNTDMKIYEICEKTGYESIDYFRKQFRKIMGIGPIEFKKNIQT